LAISQKIPDLAAAGDCHQRISICEPSLMGFVRTSEGDLIALWDVKKIYSLDHEGGGYTVMAIMRNGETVQLCRSYSMESLTRALAPLGNGASR
jgi:hypothetical protein